MTAPAQRYAVIPGWIFDLGLDPDALGLYAVLARHVNEDGYCWPSQETLATALSRTDRTVRKLLGELVAAGAVVVARDHPAVKAGRASNVYWLPRSPTDRPAGGAEHRKNTSGGQRPEHRKKASGEHRKESSAQHTHRNIEPPLPPLGGDAGAAEAEPSTAPPEPADQAETNQPTSLGTGERAVEAEPEDEGQGERQRPPPQNAHWRAHEAELQRAIGADAYRSWLGEGWVLTDDGATIRYALPSRFSVDRVERDYRARAERVLGRRLVLVVDERCAKAARARRFGRQGEGAGTGPAPRTPCRSERRQPRARARGAAAEMPAEVDVGGSFCGQTYKGGGRAEVN